MVILVKKYISIIYNMKYLCKNCNKIFDQKGHYIIHLNRKFKCSKINKNLHQNIPDLHQNALDKLKVNECEYCHKTFTRNTSLRRHLIDRCKLKKDREEIEEMKKKIEELAKEVKKSNIQNNQNINNGTIINGSHNRIKNHIEIRAYGNEDLSHITDMVFAKQLAMGVGSVEKIVQEIHYGIGNEVNCNILVMNRNDNHVLVFDGINWKINNKDEVLDEIYDKSIIMLESKFMELLPWLHGRVKERFRIFLKKKDEDEIIVRLKDRLNLMMYNNRNKVRLVRDGKYGKWMDQKVIEKPEDKIYRGDWVLNVKGKEIYDSLVNDKLFIMNREVNDKYHHILNTM